MITLFELRRMFDHYNRELFAGQLRGSVGYLRFPAYLPVSGGYCRGVGIRMRLGVDRVLSPRQFAQTLVHEMAHMWRDDGLGVMPAHDRTWADKMIAIGLYPSSTGRPGGLETDCDLPGEMNDYVVEGGAFERAFNRWETRDGHNAV